MKVVIDVPNAFRFLNVQSEQISVSEYPEYDQSTSYFIGSRVYLFGNDYESVVDSNQGNDPRLNPDKWVSMGASNLYRLTDSSLTQKMRPTSADMEKIFTWHGQQFGGGGSVPTFVSGETGGCSFRYRMGSASNTTNFADTIAMLGVSDTRLIKIFTADYSNHLEPVFATYEVDVINDNTPEWVDYIRNSDNQTTDIIVSVDKVFVSYENPGAELPQSYIEFLFLPDFVDNAWEVEPVKISELVVGRAFDLGKGRYSGLELSIQDFSRIERDDFGNAVVQRRSAAKRLASPFQIPKSQVDLTYRVLSDLRATPALYVADERVKSSIIYGIYQDFSIKYEDFDFVVADIDILGLPE